MADLTQVKENVFVTPLVSSSNLVSGSYYYPTDGGIGAGSNLSFQMFMSSSSGSISASFWATNDTATSPRWNEITKIGRDSITNSSSFVSFAVTGSSGSFMVDFPDFNYYKYRVKAVITGSNTNSLQIFQTQFLK